MTKTTLVGKCFLGVDEHAGPGIVEAMIDDTHYLVRLDADGDLPERVYVVSIHDMARPGSTGKDDQMPPWLFFDTIEHRAKYMAWMDKVHEHEPEASPGPKSKSYRH